VVESHREWTNIEDAMQVSAFGFFYNGITDAVDAARACDFWKTAAFRIENMTAPGDEGKFLRAQSLPRFDL
jgi:hypothetical protein